MPLDGVALTAAVLFLVATIGGVVAIRALFARESAVERRLRTTTGGPGPEPSLSPGLAERFADSLSPIAKAARPLNEEEMGRLRLRMSQAGFRDERALQLYLASKILLALAAALVFLWFNSSRARPLEHSVALAIALFAAGYYLPSLWLASRIKERQTAIERGLPDTLDLLVTCVEAGLGLDAALQRVAAETKLAWPVLGAELEQTFLEIKAGIPRVEAFRRMAQRTGVVELKALSATLAQTQIFGTSIALALRVQAEGIRIRRMQRAEERAAYVSVKMSLPLVMCILPTLFVFVVGPAIIRIAISLLPTLVGQR